MAALDHLFYDELMELAETDEVIIVRPVDPPPQQKDIKANRLWEWVSVGGGTYDDLTMSHAIARGCPYQVGDILSTPARSAEVEVLSVKASPGDKLDDGDLERRKRIDEQNARWYWIIALKVKPKNSHPPTL